MDTVFTPFASGFGGLLIGLAAVLLMLTLGRIFGATGLLTGIVFPNGRTDLIWRGAVLAGMVSAIPLYRLIAGHGPEIDVPVPMPALIIGGILVGIGVSYGNGCTSGHGVCGNARLSARSMVATTTFMLTAGLSVFVIRHVIGS